MTSTRNAQAMDSQLVGLANLAANLAQPSLDGAFREQVWQAPPFAA